MTIDEIWSSIGQIVSMSTLIRTSLLPYFSDTVRRLGGNPKTVIEAAGLDTESLQRPDNFIPYRKYRALLVEAVHATGCERFGFHMSELLGPQSLGVVGLAMQQAEDVSSAFQVLADFLHLSEQHGKVSVTNEGDSVRINYVIDDLELPGAAQAIDVAAAVANNLMNTLSSSKITAEVFEFPYPEPDDLTVYRSLNTRRIEFDQDRFSFLVDADRMRMSIPNRDPRMIRLLEEYVEQLDVRTGKSKADRVARIITDLLATAECSLERVAELFRVTPRTLQNWLMRENTSFHQILEQVRRELATQYLQTEGMSLTNISLLLGYSDSSTFTRSFRRWYGITPSRWRKQLPDQSSPG